METVIGTGPVEVRLLVVGPLVIIVTQLVVNGPEVFFIDIDAHLDAQVFDLVDIPG
jgi:hypothetical protein